MRLRRGIVSCRPQLSAAAGAKSREEPGQERPRAGLKREHGSDEPFGRTRYDSKSPARLARRGAKSELAQIRAHHGFVLATRFARVNLGMSALKGAVLRSVCLFCVQCSNLELSNQVSY